MAQLRDRFATERPNIATRQASQRVIDVIAEALAESARRLGRPDPLQSDPGQDASSRCSPSAFEGSYIHYGVREHAMAAAMNGIALHGGFIPYGGTFLTSPTIAGPRSGLRR